MGNNKSSISDIIIRAQNYYKPSKDSSSIEITKTIKNAVPNPPKLNNEETITTEPCSTIIEKEINLRLHRYSISENVYSESRRNTISETDEFLLLSLTVTSDDTTDDETSVDVTRSRDHKQFGEGQNNENINTLSFN